MKNEHFSQKFKCVTLIEVILDAAILSALATIVIMSLLTSLRTVTHSSVVSTAAQLANEQIETLRNYSYNDLTTQNGAIFPPGNIMDQQTVTKDKNTLSVLTDIRYVDDPYDGQAGGAQHDLNPADYKRITVTIVEPATNETLATLSTDIASRAAETNSNTGVLKVTVLDANGVALPGAHVSITNNSTVPIVNLLVDTDVNGIIFIPNLPPTSGYHVSTSKGGYSTDYTSPNTAENPTPTNEDPAVQLQQVVPVTLSIDRTANLHIRAYNLNDNQISIIVIGQKTIGNSPVVYKNIITRQVGNEEIELNNLEYDSYTISPLGEWYIKSCNPYLPTSVVPASNSNIDCYFTNDALDPRITAISPHDSPAADGLQIGMTGSNLFNAEFVLKKGTDPEIIFNSGLIVTLEGDSITGTVNFQSLGLGIYDLIYRDGTGRETIQTNAITIK